MPVKSIIDVEVDDQQFQRFKQLFDKYQEQLAKTPSAWSKVSKENAATASNFEKMAAALMAQAQVGREITEANKKQEKHLTLSERLWTSMARSSKSVAGNILSATGTLIKWAGLLTGIGAVWGFDKLATGAADRRRSAMGLGVSIGQQQSFGVNLGRFVDPNAFLSGIANAVSNVSMQGPLYALGVNPNGSTSDVAVATLRAARAKALASPANQLGLLESMYHLDQVGISTDDLRRLRSTSTQEFNAQMAHYSTDVGSFGLSDGTAKRWQDFTTQIERAGQSIFKTFVVGLSPLTGPLERLSGAFSKLLTELMKPGGLIEGGVNNLSKWIDEFSGQLSSDKFQKTVSGFLEDAGVIASGLHVVAQGFRALGFIAGGAASPVGSILGGVNSEIKRKAFLDHPSKDAYLKILAETEKAWGLPAGMLSKQWAAESSSRFNPPNSSKGAVGAFQIMPGVAKSLGINPSDPLQAAYGAAQLDAELLRRYHGDMAKALAAYNWKPASLDRVIAQHPSDWAQHVPDETKKYLAKNSGVSIVVQNATGGSATVSASQLAY